MANPNPRSVRVKSYIKPRLHLGIVVRDAARLHVVCDRAHDLFRGGGAGLGASIQHRGRGVVVCLWSEGVVWRILSGALQRVIRFAYVRDFAARRCSRRARSIF